MCSTVSKLKVYDKKKLYNHCIMAITPTFFEQIEKFWCLKLSTALGPAHGTLRRQLARVHVPKNVS